MKDQISQRLIDRGYLFELSKNLWVLTEKSMKQLNKLENELLVFLKRNNFEEWSSPHLIPLDVLKRYGKGSIKPYSVGKQLLLDPLGLTYYEFLRQKGFIKLPLLIFERKTIFRKEAKQDSFKSPDEFKRIDAFYFDSPKKVELIQNKLIVSYDGYLRKKGFKTKITRSEKKSKAEIFILTSEGLIEVANIGITKEKRSKQFKIISHKKIWSGYCSIGLYRILYCLLSNT